MNPNLTAGEPVYVVASVAAGIAKIDRGILLGYDNTIACYSTDDGSDDVKQAPVGNVCLTLTDDQNRVFEIVKGKR